MAQGATEPEVAGGRRSGRAPRWLVTAIVLLTVAVIVAGVLVAVRWNALRTAALAQDPRITYLQSVVSRNPGDDSARKQLAQVYAQVGRTKDSLNEYSKVLSHAPDDIFSLYSTGVLRLSQGDAAAAEKSLTRVLQIEPSNAYAAVALGQHYSAASRFDAIVPAVKPAADANPTLADLQYLTGLGYEKTAQKEQAITYYKRALKLVPGMSEAREGLARVGGGR